MQNLFNWMLVYYTVDFSCAIPGVKSTCFASTSKYQFANNLYYQQSILPYSICTQHHSACYVGVHFIQSRMKSLRTKTQVMHDGGKAQTRHFSRMFDQIILASHKKTAHPRHM